MAENLPESTLEYWLRGPVEGVPQLLQPVAHALLQAREEIFQAMANFPLQLLWTKPSGLASVGFHLQHIAGVIDRLFTYADGQPLSDLQRQSLSEEGVEKQGIEVLTLVERIDSQIDTAISKLKDLDPDTILQPKVVGRKKLPSTRFGLLFHAAEHTMRHTGQLLVTCRFLFPVTQTNQ
ncbi:MAG TPA: DinB family protein [Flavitalea sp.]|nr:DinB family protein [Flavitalea sp.]